MLCVTNLSLSYEDTVIIDHLSFQVKKGTILAIAGPSGCGKTTLLNALAGLISPRDGTILFDDKNLDPKTCSIGLIPQNYGLLPWKTLRQNCLLCASMKRSFTKSTEQEFIHLSTKLGITPYLNRYPNAVSGGQAQRAALARALLMNPELLLMDEPFGALDLSASVMARTLCLALCREYHSAVVFITHRPEDALYLANQIAVMEKGGHFRCVCQNPWQGFASPNDKEYYQLLQKISGEITSAAGTVS